MTARNVVLKPGDSLIVTVGKESSDSGGSSGGEGGGSGRSEDPNTWPNAMQSPMWGGSRRTGVTGQPGIENCPPDDPRTVICVPLTIPPGPGPNGSYPEPGLHPSVSSYQSQQYYRQAILSRAPGDFTNPIAQSAGNTATPGVEIGTHVKVGETIYFCWRYWSPDLNAPSAPPGPVSVSYGEGWPK